MYDVLIIGAGPAGATAARLLAREGRSVALVEKTAFPRRKVCGEFISATSLPLLYDDAIRQAFLAEAGPEIRRVGLFAGETILASAMPAADNSVAGWGRALGRDRLDTLLVDAASKAGAKLFQPWKLVQLRRVADSYASTIAGNGTTRELTARLIIAANGSWERSAWLTGSSGQHKQSELLAFKAHFLASDLASDLMPLLVFQGGYGGMVHTDQGRVTLSCCIRRDALEQCRRAYSGLHAGDAVLRHIVQNCAGVRDSLKRARLDGTWLSAGPMRPGIRPRYANGIFYAGNIAGEAHPIIAEGISMAMQSAWLLCQALLRQPDLATSEGAIAEAGRTYARAWKAVFATRVRAAALFAQVAMWPGAAMAMPLIARFPQILTLGAQWSGKAKQLVR